MQNVSPTNKNYCDFTSNSPQPLFKADDVPLETLKDLPLEPTQTQKEQRPLPAYIVNMPFKVDSDDEGKASSDEKDDGSFPKQAFKTPSKYFRLLPGDVKERRGTIVPTSISSPTSAQGTSIKSEKKGKFPSFISLLNKEVSRVSPNEDLVGVIVGFNQMRSLSQGRNESLSRRLNEQTETTIPIRKISFLWDGVWQKNPKGNQAWIPADYNEVRRFYKQLKGSNPERAEQFRKETEAHRGHMVPYREIRDVIKNHEGTKELTRLLRPIDKINKMRDAYILFLDDDIKSFRYRKDAPGALSVFNENYLSRPFEIASTGYTIKAPNNLVLEVGVLADLAVRNATAKHVKLGVYFPEPCTAVKIPQDEETIPENFSDPKQKNYTSPQEMPQLIKKVLKKRKLESQESMVFDARGAIVTTLPTRMQRSSFSCRSTQKNGIILWGLADFEKMRNISQTHYNARDWACEVLKALTYRDSLTANGSSEEKAAIREALISLLSRLFNAFDPVKLAQRAAEREEVPFQVCLINILDNYEAPDDIPKVERSKGKPRSAINKLWRQVDSINTVQGIGQKLKDLLTNGLSENLLAAAHESGAALAKLFKEKLCLNYQELVIRALSVLVDQDEKTVQAQMPEIYLDIINDPSIIQPRSILETREKLSAVNTDDFFGITPLHIAALAGNLKVALWLMDKYPETCGTMSKDSKGLIPLEYALTHCQDNGIHLDLLFALYNNNNSNEIQRMLYERIDNTADQVMVLNSLKTQFGDQIITEGNKPFFIEAILQGHDKLAELLRSYLGDDDCSKVLYDEMRSATPKVDNRLIDWAHRLGIYYEGILDDLYEQEAMLFEKSYLEQREVLEREYEG